MKEGHSSLVSVSRTGYYLRVLVLSIICLYSRYDVIAQIPTPTGLEDGYPRLYITEEEKKDLEKTIAKESWASTLLEDLHQRIDEHVDRHVTDPEWMVSRLQMYWKSKASEVYINGINYSHADGEAPVPTVRLCGSRDYTTPYAKPKLEDIKPYMEDPRGLWLPNKTKEGRPFEWAEIAKTGRIIYSINEEIIGLARDAAFIYWLEGDEKYAKFSHDIFHTYMQGIYYRSEPIDLLNGHIQTLVGFTNFQVIHEGVLKDIAELYDFLHQYISNSDHSDQIAMYEITMKKWTDQIIKNGVPQNNWNLHQAKIILKVAMVLQSDEKYKDRKGREYYIDYILNQTSARQWSLTKFMEYGYDEDNGVWAECPGYSIGVTKDLTKFISDFDNTFNYNLLPYLPVMTKAVNMLPQYLFPNGQIVAFGDTYYGTLNTEAMSDMVRIAQKNDDPELESDFTSLLSLFDTMELSKSPKKIKTSISSFFNQSPLKLDRKYAKGDINDYVTQTFYAPNVSWHVQRSGQGKDGMMISLNGSLGNHMHANGINMELYGKGLVQGADPGKGAGYLQPIYLEYYSQFPAHNTVMVDGASSYTEMLSRHAFDLISSYPASEKKQGFFTDITYSDVYFLEPETRSDQERVVSIVRTGEDTGYYVDIFRSRKQRGGDKFHDYFYHNLGQSMKILDANGKDLDLSLSEEMGFAGGHLYAFDYMWDKKSTLTADDYQVQWKIDYQDEEDIFMNLWMKGEEGREVFSIKSPPCKSFRRDHNLPYDVSKEPYLTFAARQHGEAWEHPFVSVYEPFTSSDGRSVQSISGFEDENGSKAFAGVKVVHKSGRVDHIFSCQDGVEASYNQMSTDAAYTLMSSEGEDFIIFMGNGTKAEGLGFSVSSSEIGNVVLERKRGRLFIHNEVPATVINDSGLERKFAAADYREISLD